MTRRAAVFALTLLALIGTARGFENDAPLADPALEARARALAKQFRCLVCQNESIFASDAALAKDLRQIVREQILAGSSDQQVTGFLVARYGDFVLLKPPVKPRTYLLWFGPAAIVLLAGLGIFRHVRRTGARAAAAPLSDAERKRVQVLIDGDRD